jgi:hypothetical protein
VLLWRRKEESKLRTSNPKNLPAQMTVPIHHRESAVVSITFAPAALLTLRFEIFQQSACQKCLILSLITCEIVQILFIEQCSTVFCNEFYFYPQKFRYVRKATYLIQSLLSARLLTKLRVVSFNFNSPFEIAFSRDLIVQIIPKIQIRNSTALPTVCSRIQASQIKVFALACSFLYADSSLFQMHVPIFTSFAVLASLT